MSLVLCVEGAWGHRWADATREATLSVLGWGLAVGRARVAVLSGSLPPVGAQDVTRPSCWFLDLLHVHWVTSQQGVLVARSQLPSID